MVIKYTINIIVKAALTTWLCVGIGLGILSPESKSNFLCNVDKLEKVEDYITYPVLKLACYTYKFTH